VNCITGIATQYLPSKLIIDAAVAAGVNFFFANEFVGHVTGEQFKRLPESFAGAKLRVREYLQQLANEGKMAWTSLNGGPFFDMCECLPTYTFSPHLRQTSDSTLTGLMKGPGGFDIANRRARIYGTGENILFWTPLPTMGLAAANMLRNPDSILNRPIYICPFNKLTQNMLLSTLESVLDTKFTVENVDVEKINKNANIILERGGPDASRALRGLAFSTQYYEKDSGNNFSHLVENETVGVEVMSVEHAVRETLERYGKDCKVVESMFRVEASEV
jgi:hypothetical protein